MINDNLEKFINPERQWCIIKMSPIVTEKEIDNYYNQLTISLFYTIPIRKEVRVAKK